MVESVNITAQILLVSNDLEFNTKDSSNYFTDVISDTTEPLAHICTEIFNPQTPLEQKNISNADAFLNKIYFVVLERMLIKLLKFKSILKQQIPLAVLLL